MVDFKKLLGLKKGRTKLKGISGKKSYRWAGIAGYILAGYVLFGLKSTFGGLVILSISTYLLWKGW